MKLLSFMQEAVEWHSARFPDAEMQEVFLKLVEEVGEVGSAINARVGNRSATGRGNLDKELADVFICWCVLAARYAHPFTITEEILEKMDELKDPNGIHPASLGQRFL